MTGHDFPLDWTCDEKGRSNSSAQFVAIVAHVERLIRREAHSLIDGRVDIAARLIVAQLAHVHRLAPPGGTPSSTPADDE